MKNGVRRAETLPSLPYLIHRIARRLETRINRAARSDGLKIENVRILLRLERADHQRVGDLAEATSIEQSALSHMLKRMEGSDLLTRGKMPDDDSRSVIISLTLRGRQLARKYGPLFQQLDDASLGGLSLPDRRRLKSTLINIYERLAESTDAGYEGAAPG